MSSSTFNPSVPLFVIILRPIKGVSTLEQNLRVLTPFVRSAIVVRASKIVVVHNHPLGSPEPSAADIQGAQEVHKLGAMMRLPLIDFIIIGENGYRSLDEMGVFDEDGKEG